jgi:hypothetical protein
MCFDFVERKLQKSLDELGPDGPSLSISIHNFLSFKSHKA